MSQEPHGPVAREQEAVREEPAPPPPPPAQSQEREAVREEPTYPPPPPAQPQEREVVHEERYYRPPEPRTSSLALASLATGISAYFIFPIAGAIAAIVTGFLAQSEIRASNGRLTGAPFATAGLVLGWVQIGIVIAVAIFIGIFAAAAPGFQMGLPGSLFGG